MEQIDPMLARQYALEADMVGRGASRYRRAAERDMAAGRTASTAPGTFLVKRTIAPLKEAIEQFVADCYAGKPGPRAHSARILKDLPSDTTAYLAVKLTLDAMANRGEAAAMNTAKNIAKAIDDELRLNAFEKSNPGLFIATMNRTMNICTTTAVHARRVLVHTMNKHDIEWQGWTVSERTVLGMKLIELLAEATGFVEIVNAPNARGKWQYIVRLTDKVDVWFREQLLRGELLQPVMLPTLVPPVPVEGLMHRGYHTNVIRLSPLVRRGRKDHLEVLEQADLGLVYRGLNALQDTRWRINGRVLDVVQKCVDMGLTIADLVPSDDPPLPPKPLDIDTNHEAEVAWRRQARDHYGFLVRLRGKRLRQATVLECARSFVNEGAIFFPHSLDFRGRAYPLPNTLTPQGNDMVKALLHFEEALPLGNDTAIDWFLIHGANLWGIDKCAFEDRIAWVEEMHEQIIRSAQDPLGFKWWTGADKPWSFLAFAFEYERFAVEGTAFRSRLPVALDGSCNGLQHFSAMLRDPVGGEAVNLTPSDKPQDIYQRVADVVVAQLKAEQDPEKKWMAETFLALGVDRKVTKRPVMVLPYGGTRRSCLQYVGDAMREKYHAGVNPFGLDEGRAVAYLAGLVWDGIGNVVVAARAAMDWLQKVARLMAKANLPMWWETPSGFRAYQGYVEVKERKIKTKLNGSIIQMIHREETEKLDKTKQATAISPNFVHSMDAAAMFLTIEAMQGEGISSFAMIHDSYGTHAANAEAMAQCIRQEFCRMYSVDVLGQFRDHVLTVLPEELHDKLPPVPEMGTLRLDRVLTSDFFFA